MKKLLIIATLFLVACGPNKQTLDRAEFFQQKYPFLNPKECIILAEHFECKINECSASFERGEIQRIIDENLRKNEENPEGVSQPQIITSINKFSSIETGLPTGTIISVDFEGDIHGETFNRKNNHVAIKGSDGYTRIIRDVDVDLFNNLHKNDIIE